MFLVRLLSEDKSYSEPEHCYGQYRVEGEAKRSRHFQVEGQPELEELTRGLSITTNAAMHAQSFQGAAGIRCLTRHDQDTLKAAAEDLDA